jgi:tRNA(fMet)-specific endonuclease VapC
MKYLLDTNICIYIIKRKPPQIIKKFGSLRIGDVAISSITLAELEYGVCKSTHPEQNTIALTKFLAPISILPFEDMPQRPLVLYEQILN